MNMLGLKIKPKQFMDIEIFVWEVAAPLDSSAATDSTPAADFTASTYYIGI